MSERKNSYRMFPKRLSDCVGSVAQQALQKKGFAETRIISQWKDIVGEAYARHSLPQKLSFVQGKRSHGVLHIATHGSWALELQHLEPVILEKISLFFGYRAVDRLVIHQGLAAIKTEKATAPLLPDPATEQALTHMLADIKDEALRESMATFGRHILTKKP